MDRKLISKLVREALVEASFSKSSQPVIFRTHLAAKTAEKIAQALGG